MTLPGAIHSQTAYYIALGGSFFIAFMAYYFLTDFSSEMSKFEFQPD